MSPETLQKSSWERRGLIDAAIPHLVTLGLGLISVDLIFQAHPYPWIGPEYQDCKGCYRLIDPGFPARQVINWSIPPYTRSKQLIFTKRYLATSAFRPYRQSLCSLAKRRSQTQAKILNARYSHPSSCTSKQGVCRFVRAALSTHLPVMTCIPFCNVFDVYLCKVLLHVRPLTTSISSIDAPE